MESYNGSQQLMQKYRAFTLVEMLIALLVVGIIASGVIVGMQNMIVQQRLEGAANRIFADLRLAQSEAIKRNDVVYVSFKTEDESWCYGISANATCHCNQPNSCQLDGKDSVVSNKIFDGVFLQSAKFAGNTGFTAFDPRNGFAKAGSVKNGTVWLKSKNDEKLAVILNRVGRIRFCSPDLGNYSKQCPDLPK